MGTTQGGTRATSGMVGREQDLHRARDLLRSGEQLITLRGPGGIGKTTLARALVNEVHAEYDHVLFVDLSALRDPQQVLPTISAALPITSPLPDPQRNIIEFARDTPTLLVLDNFEQLLPAAEHLAKLIEQAPSLHLVVTSRAALHLHDECECALDPLALPSSLRDASESPAVQLFVRRARASVPKFELTDENAEQVARLCVALEGVPLAIELAASRLRVYVLADLMAKLEHPLNVLKVDFRDRPERLRSLRAAVEWSYDLLPDEDREVFECCAAFVGSFTPDALVAVWSGEDVLERVEHLIEQSFLQRVEGPVTRWKMLHPLRELALEKLDRNPQAGLWRERHARHFMQLAEGLCKAHLVDPPNMRERYLPDYPNVITGLNWAVEQKQAEIALRYLDGMPIFWVPFGLQREGYEITRKVLELPAPGLGHLRPRALHVAATCVHVLGRPAELEALVREMLDVSREQGDETHELYALLGLAIHHGQLARIDEALQLNEDVIRRLQERVTNGSADKNHHLIYAHALNNLAFNLLELGHYAEAMQNAKAARTEYQAIEHPASASGPLVGDTLMHLGLIDDAIREYLNSLRDSLRGGYRVNQAWALRALGRVMAERGDKLLVVRLYALAEQVFPMHSRSYLSRLFEAFHAELRGALPVADYQAAWAEGARWSVEEALATCVKFFASAGAESPGVLARSAPSCGLTARELEVLKLVVQGHPDRRVAKLLGISPVTASKHVSNMLSKLGLHNRTELARWAIVHQVGTSIQ